MSFAFAAAAEEEHELVELIFDPFWFGVIALVVMMGLLALLWSFRNTLALDPVAHHGDHAGATDEADSSAGH
ncbi:hypothetical protein [Ornithinimicrobium sp. INDO-MA30-4]|uniref:hypothetical protein n=1 Tax=Ornithinimicrobium sp. INDO-MA30-4 TaxID=2908651 RepID=UPI001F1DCCF3|nr:hypothetical protein [Ornithinimicrobium sp. INDO-MA30-4]UJH70876.1 hypothetical protein L0A91_02465 [Ornithinimicrobium sp. INDO-MA30-4]